MRSFLKQGMICFLAIFISLVSQAQQIPDRIFMNFFEASVNSDGYFSDIPGTANAADCLITGASSTCPQSIEGFSAPAGMVSYSWSITGNGFINGAANLDSVYIISSSVCNGSYTLTLTITDESQQQFICSKTVSVIDNTGPALTVPASIALQCTDPLPLMPLNINSSPNFINGTYNIGTAVFGAPLTSTPVTADAVLVNDGTGGAGNPYDACESIINDLTGKIAVIERSGCLPPASYFVNKAYKAQLAGAVGVIFIFNQPGDQVVTMGLPAGPNPTITIPLLLVSNNYGNTLKAELLAGPVNVSLSEQTVFVNDACSFAPINFTEEFVPGNCPSNYNVIRTWTATDQCGNTTSASQTIMYADNTPPALTVPANLALQCSDPLPLMPLNINSSPNFIEGTYNVGTAVFGAPLTATPLTAEAVLVVDDAGNPYDACENITNNLSGKIAVIERSGCTPPASYFVTKAYKAQQAGAVGVIFIFNVPGNQVATMGLPPGPNPTITIPLILVSNSYGNTLKAEILAGPVNVSLSVPTVIATDQCSFASITHQQTFTPGSCPSNYTLVNTWTATDQCGNATSASQTIAVADNTAPTITVPSDTTLQCTDPLPLMPLNINSSPNNIAGTYNIGTAVFGAPLTSTPVTADAVLVNDGTGGAGNPYDACESIINDLTGKIAVIERSGCTPPASYFVNKAYKAQLAGAVGVIFIFNQPGNNVVTMGLPAGPNPTITIPLMLVSNSYGNTLKAEILAGPVNVSMSEQTVIVNDTCSFASISFTETFTPGSCPANSNLVRTWTATDQCGNATSASQTISIVDTTPPVITVPADTTLQCTDPLPLMPLNINSSPNNIAGTYNVGTAVFGAPLTSTPVTADAVLVNDGTGGAGNPYDACESIINDLTGKIAVIERSGCTPPASYFVNKAYKAQLAGAVGVIFIFNQPGDQVATMGLPPGPNPTITIPLLLVSNNYGNTLKAELLAGTVNVSMSEQTVFVNDACSFASISYSESFSPGSCPANYNLVRTWTATDQCGNATSASQTISIVDTTPPTITVPANITLQCSDPLPLMPLNINSSPNFINGTYNIGTAVFGAPLTSTPVTADAVLVNDGTGGAGNPYDACESIINDLTGKIAVIERSGCTPPASYFVNKAYKAQLAGAVGVIFIFNQPGDQVVTMGLPPGPNPAITIPLMLVSNNYGNTLKAELLAGTVNVSMSEQTVLVNDECSFASISFTENFVPGNCPSNYSLVRTWTATDQCGNAASASQTITITDNTPPTLTVPANLTLQCTDPLPLKPLEINSSPNFIDGTYNIGTAVFGAPLTPTPVTADAVLVNDGTGGAGNPYDACESIINDLTGKIAVIERSGCVPPASYFVTKAYKAQLAGAVGVIFIFNVPGNQVATMGLPPGPNPTITIPLMLVSNTYGNTLKAEILAGPVNVSLSAPTVTATDNCSFATITHQQTFTPGSCPSNYTLTNTWTATDQCGNATSASQTITIADTTRPTLTVPSDVTLQCTDPLPIKPLEINSSPNFIEGTYNVGTAVFGAPLTSTPLTADAILVNDGTGGAGNPYDACESIINDLTGKIAVIERSGCTPPASYFVNKAYKAQLAGAVGVIFISNQPGNYIFNMGLPAGPNPTITIPLMLVSNGYGAGLKSELLAGPVNVSLSAPTVVASDVCSFVSITHQQTFTPGGCGSNFTIVNTWTATDQCGNATTASQTVTSVDNTAPTLTVPANVTLQCNTPLPLEPLHVNSSPNSLTSTYNVGTAIFGAPLTSTPVTANAIMVNDGTGGAGNPYDACESIINSLTGKIAVIERSGCTPPASYFVNKAYKAQLAGAVGVIFISNVPGNYVFNMGLPAGPNPTITIPLMLVSNNYGATLKAGILAGTVNLSLSAPTVIASDACSFVAITHSKTTTAGTCPSNYTITNTWTAADQCGNTSTASQTITVVDNVAPGVTCKANQTRLTGNGYCIYTASGSEFDVLSATDNCAGPVSLSYTLSGATSGSGSNTLSGAVFNTGVTTVNWKATDGCGNFATCSFTVTVNDNQNNTNYIIYAKQQASFDQNNFIGGDVGVSSTTGTAEFDKYDVLDPFKVRAKNITVKTPSSVNNRVYSAANDGPAPAFMVYNGNTSGLSNVTVSSNGVLNGNWKDVKVKKGVVVTINGNNFGVITIEEGATVTFGATLINMAELKVESGKKNVNKTRVIFNGPSSVKVKTKVTVEDDCLVNSGGPKVTFYLGDNNADEEKFRVKGNNSDITANIMIPNGKLKIDGGKADRPVNMTGWFIIEKLEAGKYVYWNKYSCNNEEARSAFVSADNEPVKEATIEVQEIVVQPSVDEFRVNAYPNPSAYDFGIIVHSKNNEPIRVRILDASGRMYGTIRTVTKGTVIKLGSELKSGTYFAEVVQGNNRKTVKLIKLN
ncbi:MAG: T9SS type A sorting domain-containing protein [Ferruginibacter sp.]|nr:T9SS type A sorting domain-containing protein [Ferruginibacter sp.]